MGHSISQIEIDIAEYLINNKDELKSLTHPKQMNIPDTYKFMYTDILNDKILDNLKKNLIQTFNTNSEIINLIINYDFVINVLGEDFFL